mmetsp:Transcript_13793/g.23117  ORF Transcript_13793/g.23117 Transcript_13793/m.23117 type:complete len:215 (+) Transcript_13793:156-800(+)
MSSPSLCQICFDDSVNVVLTCGHEFCEDCLNDWTKKRNRESVCPMCREPLHDGVDDDDDDDDSNFVETDNDFGDNEEGENNLSLHRKRKLIKEKDLLREMALQPDLIVLFHPGVSDDSYDWIEELKIIKNDLSSKGHKGSSTQLLVTTGSRAEMIMEIDTIGQALNLNFTQMISGNDISFNPCSSHMLLQSGTIANELYRKNAWCVRICPARQI